VKCGWSAGRNQEHLNIRRMKMDIIRAIEKEYQKESAPKIEIGDYVKVHVKVKEGNRERLQVFEGTIIGMKGAGLKETFTVRRISYGVGVERIFPLHSPTVDHIDVVRHGKVRRAKLYYLRDRVGKAAKVKERLVKQA
jgi:large subunit ribosomal protein L19